MRMLPGERYFFQDRSNDESTYRNYQFSLKFTFKRAGVPHRHVHMFRDTFAVELLLADVPLERVSKLLGHTSIKTTEIHYGPWVKARQQQFGSQCPGGLGADGCSRSVGRANCAVSLVQCANNICASTEPSVVS